MDNFISLCGDWFADYLSDSPYTGESEPDFVSGTPAVCPVPGYWEDLGSVFSRAGLDGRIKTNPRYRKLEYPMTGYAPDTEFPNPVGCFVYRRVFDIPGDGQTRGATLSFGGVQNAVSAWINGIFIGRHEGYSTPFCLDIPDGVLVFGENTVTLAVSNNRLAGYAGNPVSGVSSRAVCECTGGIYGDVSLVFRPDGLRDVSVRTEKDLGSVTFGVAGATDADKTVVISDGAEVIGEYRLPAGRDRLKISSDGMKTWDPDCPKLYLVTVITEKQMISARFGVRRMTVDGTRLKLNGKPFLFRGACEHFYQPETLHPTRDPEYYRMMIRRLREFGFNSIRFHTWVPPVEYLDAADELGMVIEVEAPNNTSLEEWRQIVSFCGNHPSVCIYSTGNELMIDDEYEKHLRACADLVHLETDSLFSPMSAMRGVEYFLEGEKNTVEEPFEHNAGRLGRISEYCDLYNSYSLGLTSYFSTKGTVRELERNNSVFGKPLLSHEIGIFGTYIDLSLEDRYRGTRMGKTGFMSSVRRHLADRGLLENAQTYYRNSVKWQEILRKQCIETVRRCRTFSGYDYLGPIDTHWHTFGYCVGFMNEFFELKEGLSVDDIKRYNSPTVLLADTDRVNYSCGDDVTIPLAVSNYSGSIPSATLDITVRIGDRTVYHTETPAWQVTDGGVTELPAAHFIIPQLGSPARLTVCASLSGGNIRCDNSWEIYAFPDSDRPGADELEAAEVDVLHDCTEDELTGLLEKGRRVVLLGTGPFGVNSVSWQISIAGRTEDHLATVIADHPLMRDFPHDGFCGRQFESMMRRCSSIILDNSGLPHKPVIDVASSYKNAHREALIFECSALNGKLLVCTLSLNPKDPASVWLMNSILRYASGNTFDPETELDAETLHALCSTESVNRSAVKNEAHNMNDITMSRGKLFKS